MRFSQPYRGQPRPKYPRPKKQIRDLRTEKVLRWLTVGICALVLLVLFRIILSLYYTHPDEITLSVIVGLGILFVLITIAIADGLKSINKFRKGYDIDVSGESEDEASKQREEIEN